jgi:hypothetical protein
MVAAPRRWLDGSFRSCSTLPEVSLWLTVNVFSIVSGGGSGICETVSDNACPLPYDSQSPDLLKIDLRRSKSFAAATESESRFLIVAIADRSYRSPAVSHGRLLCQPMRSSLILYNSTSMRRDRSFWSRKSPRIHPRIIYSGFRLSGGAYPEAP